ncbi:MAG TPA: hypothetical protein VJB18_00895 [Burkholderiales bacterium]|nr:hypothetical protein [Burkholderiales bacterium]
MWNWHKSCTFHIESGARITAVALLLVSGAHASEELSKLPDPTRPYRPGAETPAGAREATTGSELQSTMISPTFRRAIISGRTYKVGDRIDGAVIADIQPYEVTLKRSGRETRLRLLPRLTKEPRISAEKSGNDG